MSTNWDDFDDLPKKFHGPTSPKQANTEKFDQNHDMKPPHKIECDWGFGSQASDDEGKYHEDDNFDYREINEEECKRFIPLYENYLKDKKSVVINTHNSKIFSANPKRAMQNWFSSVSQVFKHKINKIEDDQHVCELTLPICENSYIITSDICKTEDDAVVDACLTACRLLDEARILYFSEQMPEMSRDSSNMKSNKRLQDDDDSDEIDYTSCVKRPCASSTKTKNNEPKSNVQTYETLMARWTELNMSILKSKAELVRLDLDVKKHLVSKRESEAETSPGDEKDSTTTGSDDELDPLDEFMSNLEKQTSKTTLTREEKIEKSRLRVQIADYERQQKEVSRLIEIAKPRFNLDKIGQLKTKEQS